MRISVAAVGRLKQGPERDLCERYIARATALGRGLGLAEVCVREIAESRAARAQDRAIAEAVSLRRILVPGARLVALDERGPPLTSAAFANDILRARDAGVPAYALVIGGADGLASELRGEADLVLSFGPMTWPHQLVRIMAAEQVYRATTILAGHPYHRA
ncbi:MAG TPA: 23S rRNA (pseudouridine(1915)-N(3))-methyltransferase RlmH [Beijerinckiaceae bacterium]|nr:23S rRNA (pseudouridine(1915)-N(3))-methyltransferase RlmH [Beijerinckiaceae bacterium]